MNEVYLMDCMEGMKEYADNHFELAIVDPPYGIGNFIQMSGKVSKNPIKVKWNNSIPALEYFTILKSVSKNQIIWGWNYYTELLGPSNSLIYWHKRMGSKTYSAGELAWTSFNHALKFVEIALLSQGTNRIHPCQKPVALYKWLLQNYAKPGDKILDTHVGSGSCRIACHEMGFDFTGYEIDADYWKAQEKRFYHATRQRELLEV